jgi:Homeodomain-like domain
VGQAFLLLDPAKGVGFKDAEVRVRAQALWLLDQGRSQEETAAILGLNVTTFNAMEPA